MSRGFGEPAAPGSQSCGPPTGFPEIPQVIRLNPLDQPELPPSHRVYNLGHSCKLSLPCEVMQAQVSGTGEQHRWGPSAHHRVDGLCRHPGPPCMSLLLGSVVCPGCSLLLDSCLAVRKCVFMGPLIELRPDQPRESAYGQSLTGHWHRVPGPCVCISREDAAHPSVSGEPQPASRLFPQCPHSSPPPEDLPAPSHAPAPPTSSCPLFSLVSLGWIWYLSS